MYNYIEVLETYKLVFEILSFVVFILTDNDLGLLETIAALQTKRQTIILQLPFYQKLSSNKHIAVSDATSWYQEEKSKKPLIIKILISRCYKKNPPKLYLKMA